MLWEQCILIIGLFGMLGMFIWGRWRYDVVAALALFAMVVLGVIPPAVAFDGFGEPAVITVVAVLLVSRGLQNSGLITVLTRHLGKLGKRPMVQLVAMTLLITVLSGFMNNIGALALLMPVALQTARRLETSPSLFLLPMAFGSLLGGMTTLIGTPPNIIIANARTRYVGEPFSMFDFSPVGAAVAIGGFLFLVLIGWRLIPQRKGGTTSEELFEIESYFTELEVPAESKMVDKTVQELERLVERDLIVIAIVRGSRKINNPSRYETLRAKDIIVVEADPETLEGIIHSTGLELAPDKELEHEIIGNEDVHMMESIVMPGTNLINKQAGRLRFRYRFGVNILGVARQGARISGRFSRIRLRVGDILLLRGTDEGLGEALSTTGLLPLAGRGVRLEAPRLGLALALFGAGLATAAVGWLPIQIAFFGVVLGMILTGLLQLKELYSAVDWPIIVLLGALMPIGEAAEYTGTAQLVGDQIALLGGYLPPTAVLTLILVGTMFLSDIINNAAAALLMAPVAAGVALSLGLNPDPFLMATAIGASCAFLTPIGHQCSALVLGPGGYQFGDYARVGLPLELLITLISIPMLRIFFPF